MTRRAEEIGSVYLKPGELCISESPVVVTTVLGSCVSLTMFHRESGTGAICHAVQPICRHQGQCPGACPDLFRYVACVVPVMVNRFRRCAGSLAQVEVKLFGGGAILRRGEWGRLAPVGRQNVEAAMEAIETAGLRLKVADVGGPLGRRIRFNTQNGEVLLQRVRSLNTASRTAGTTAPSAGPRTSDRPMAAGAFRG